MPAEEVARECCKLTLMGDSDENSEDLNADRNAASKSQAQEVSVRKEDCTGCYIPAHVCYALEENLSAFCSFQRLLETKCGRLINLVEEIIRQSNVETVA